MEAEELIKYLKKCVDDLDLDYKSVITPIMYDPNVLQYDVCFIIMEKVEDGSIPRFKVNVKDITKRNFK